MLLVTDSKITREVSVTAETPSILTCDTVMFTAVEADNDYYNLLQFILANEKIRKHSDFANLKLPERNPFIIGMLAGDKQHEGCFVVTFSW